MKKKVILILIVLGVFGLTGCSFKEESSDALKFKEEYESLNGTSNSSGLEYRSVTISEDNPYVYKDAEKIVQMIENGETFYLYVGDKQCPWCRSVIEKSIEVAKEYDIKTIYYVNIWDDEHNEILRDVYKLDSDNNPYLVSEGIDAYYKLLSYLDSVLSEYTLTTEDGEKVDVLEKRLYAPNYIYIENGTPIKLVEGISELQTNSREELTESILEDEAKQFEELFKTE